MNARSVTLVLMLGVCAASPALAQTPAPASPAAPAADTSCAVAAPSCFKGCSAGQVRSAAGQCVPASPPSQTAQPDVILETAPLWTQAPAAAPALDPGERPCCYVTLQIGGQGLKNLGDHAATQDVHVDVRINGQLVGATPFNDALPPGDYWVEAIGPSGQSRARGVALRPGKPQGFVARFGMALDAQEAAARDTWRRERVASARDAARAEWVRKQEAERAELAQRDADERKEYERAHADWEQRTRPIRAERSTKRTIGFVTGGAGIAFAITGGVLVAMAASSQQDAEHARDRWQASASKDERATWLKRLDDAQDKRDLQQALGLSALGLGVAGIATGCAFLLMMPELEREPRPLNSDAAHAELAPLIAPGGAGALLRLRL